MTVYHQVLDRWTDSVGKLEIVERDPIGYNGKVSWEEVTSLERKLEGHFRQGMVMGAVVPCPGPIARLRHSHPQLPGGQPTDGSELSPSPANRLDLTWWLWSHGLGP